MNIDNVDIDKLKINEKNPRFIKDYKFKKLCKSLDEFPDMMQIRPIVSLKDGTIIGGNMRYRAAKELKWKTIPVIYVDNFDEAKQAEFIIKDNISHGEWNIKSLIDSWDSLKLEDWGFDNVNSIFNVDKINELEEWIGMPEFIINDNDIKLIIRFDNEEDRNEFINNYNITINKKLKNAYISKYPFNKLK